MRYEVAIYIFKVSHTFSMTNCQHETNLVVMRLKDFSKILIEFAIISDILLLTSSYNYFLNIFPNSKGCGVEAQQIFQNYFLVSYFVSGQQRMNIIFLWKLSWRMPLLFLSHQDCMCVSRVLSCKGQEGKSKLASDPYLKVYLTMALIIFSLYMRTWSVYRTTLF